MGYLLEDSEIEEDMSYYYDPITDEDFIKIAQDVYGSGVRDNTREQLIALGKEYHLGIYGEDGSLPGS